MDDYNPIYHNEGFSKGDDSNCAGCVAKDKEIAELKDTQMYLEMELQKEITINSYDAKKLATIQANAIEKMLEDFCYEISDDDLLIFAKKRIKQLRGKANG